jgi:hypothetical protein
MLIVRVYLKRLTEQKLDMRQTALYQSIKRCAPFKALIDLQKSLDTGGISLRISSLHDLTFHLLQVDVALLEVGIGGRYDATNVVSPLYTISKHLRPCTQLDTLTLCTIWLSLRNIDVWLSGKLSIWVCLSDLLFAGLLFKGGRSDACQLDALTSRCRAHVCLTFVRLPVTFLTIKSNQC